MELTEGFKVNIIETAKALCGHKRQCDHDLLAGTAREHFAEYCPNTPTIEQIKKSSAN